MRQGWDTNKELSLPGNRLPGVPSHSLVKIRFGCTCVENIKLETSVDTGSEISFINNDTVCNLEVLHFSIEREAEEIQLADGQTITLSGHINISIMIDNQYVWHMFCVILILKSAALIGVDLWVKLNFASSSTDC